MTLRKRLLCLFTPPVLLVLLVMWVLGHNLLLARLDQEDKQLLTMEGDRLRATLDIFFERDADRLRDLVQVLDDPAAPLSWRRTGFDFVIQAAAAGTPLVLQPVSGHRVASLNANQPLVAESLQASIEQRLSELAQAVTRLPSGQLITLEGVPVMLVAAPAKGGYLFGGTFLDTARINDLRRQLGGTLIWAPPAETERKAAVLGDSGQISVTHRQLLDGKRHSIDLVFYDSIGNPQLSLQLIRDRHLYLEGIRQLNIFTAVLAAALILAWVVIHLGLEGFLLRRIRRMHSQLSSIGPETTGIRLQDRGNDELGALAKEANQMLDRLEQSEARDAAILAGIQEGYFELDALGHLQAVNPAFCRQLGYSQENLLGESFAVLLENDEDLAAVLGSAGQHSGPVFSGRMRRADGSFGHYEAGVTRIFDNNGKPWGYRGILHDVSAHVDYQDRLYDMAHKDALTGLGNRKAFHEYLRGMLSDNAQPLALLFIDLDRFKQVNDTFGHEVGDQLLICIARRLENAVREPDRAFRLGGDEFTLVAVGSDAHGARLLAQRLLRVLGEPIRLNDHFIDFVTPSIGVALSPPDSRDTDQLIKDADAAMYEAKRQRNQYCMSYEVQ